MSIYYIYAYLRIDNTPYYIGKGSGRRAWSKNRIIQKPKDVSRIIILKENLDEKTAFSIEKELIAHYGRKDLGTGILYNSTDGGEGISGHKHSKKSLQKINASKIGRNHSEETKQKIRDFFKGKTKKPHSEETKQKISEKCRGRKMSEEHKQKIRDAQLGIPKPRLKKV